ncbi:BamA/OMP85 family outer membrane protein [Deinococcus yavapaiensis]|uniref:Outer membrane protein insertion porin family n=1 Tax=Deinococcus yavapaiensis KR-236 TaxID=694435 RepID=A0A318SMX5_9DEIO|nr:POTRA domain-containing protein [Deinococcus yavapaiensis]PYE56242.1 outer membrane protein insertion porin family [Deinococcus yavapaiensis KR-236]
MRNFITIGLTAALVSAPLAQAQQATLDDIVVVGANDLLANFLRVSLSVQPGVPLSSVNLRAVELETVNSGFFRSATAELRTENGRQVLRITVVPNASISSVSITGASFIPIEQITAFLEQRLNIASGATLNTARIEESKDLLRQAYRDNGFPFSPGVSAEVRPSDAGVTVNYIIDEKAPVSRVEVTGNTQLPNDVVQEAFRPLVQGGTFNPQAYQQGLLAVARAYSDRGFAGSGPDASQVTLENGVLKIALREVQVASVDTSALGNVAGVTLTTRQGGLLNQNVLAADIRSLSNAVGKPVTIQVRGDAQNPFLANVAFVVSDQQSGPVREIRIAGATAVPVDDIARVLSVRVGDTFNQEIAQLDYRNIQRLYNSRGFEISTRDPISYQDGVLTFAIREVRIGGYELSFQGTRNTQDRVILRELPDVGTVFNANDFRRGIERLIRTGLVKPPQVTSRVDPLNPENLIFTLALQEQQTGVFTPSLSYDTINGFSGELALSGNNLFGLGYGYAVGVSAAPNPVGEVLSANAQFTIPWLDFDFLDFRRNRTSLTVNLATTVTANNPINDPSKPAAQQRTGREYTQRATGGGISIGRSITPELAVGFNVSTQYTTNRLEPLATGETSDYTNEQASALVPEPGLTTFFGVSANYDNANSPEFPTSGVRANSSAGYGFGSQGTTGLSFTQLTGGARTYFGLGNTLPDGTQQQAVALRVNGGTIIGSSPASQQFILGGSNTNEALTLRGYDAGTFAGKNFISASAEYRYNFNLNAGFAQGLYGVVFADVGDAWNNASDFGLNVGYGVGVQLNLGIGSTLLPALRFDYGFSPANPRGKFSFRLGNFF